MAPAPHSRSAKIVFEFEQGCGLRRDRRIWQAFRGVCARSVCAKLVFEFEHGFSLRKHRRIGQAFGGVRTRGTRAVRDLSRHFFSAVRGEASVRAKAVFGFEHGFVSAGQCQCQASEPFPMRWSELAPLPRPRRRPERIVLCDRSGPDQRASLGAALPLRAAAFMKRADRRASGIREASTQGE